MTTKADTIEALNTIKGNFKTPGCCFILTELKTGKVCGCVLCLCDKVRDYIEEPVTLSNEQGNA